MTSTLSINQTRILLPAVPVEKLLKSLEPKAKTLNNYNKPFHATRARWIVEAKGRRPEDPVFVYFHGGGYCLPLLRNHVKFLIHLSNTLRNPRFSILVVDYSLSPEVPFPTPIIEAATIYADLVDKEGCTKIILSGDSAGGNLSVVLSAHLKHHHPDIPLPKTYVQPFAEVLISPWVNLFPEHTGSYVENFDADILGPAVKDWAKAYCTDVSLRKSPWVSPIEALPSYWKGVFPKHTLVTSGENEVLKDDIVKFVKLANLPQIYFEVDGCHNSLFSEKDSKEHVLLFEIVKYLREALKDSPVQELEQQQTVGETTSSSYHSTFVNKL